MNKAPLSTALVFLVTDDEILLGKKARGHGIGKWNGAGGKYLPGEQPEACAKRELQEELGVSAPELDHVATLTFTQEPAVDQYSNIISHVYFCKKWTGEPQASDELSHPTWFPFGSIPYEAMWEDDQHWLPFVLDNKRLTATFVFDSAYQLVSYEVTPVETL